MRHLAELKEAYSEAVDTQMAATDLARNHPVHPLDKAARAVKKARAYLKRDDVPPIIEDLLDKLANQERQADETEDPRII